MPRLKKYLKINQLRKKANEISKEITELTIKINKRKELLRNQARDIQTSDSSNSLIETLLSSESISDA